MGLLLLRAASAYEIVRPRLDGLELVFASRDEVRLLVPLQHMRSVEKSCGSNWRTIKGIGASQVFFVHDMDGGHRLSMALSADAGDLKLFHGKGC